MTSVFSLARTPHLLLSRSRPSAKQSPLARPQRWLQIALGLVWLLDAALQYQPSMFERAFASQVIAPTADGNPAPIAHSVLWAAHVIGAHPVIWNALFATVQLALALGLLWRPTVKPALAVSVIWSLVVWWLAEGFGGVLAGGASPLMGAPGAVILYALLALLAWPSERGGDSIAGASVLRGGALAAWVVLWSSEAYFALLPANDSSSALHGMVAGMADGEPGWLASLDRSTAGLLTHHGATIGITFGALLALAALAPALPRAFSRALLALALLLAALIWIPGQDFGGILTGQGTDPNSGLLLALLALAYWPLRRQPRAAASTDGRTVSRRPLRTTIALAAIAAAAAGGSAVAAATSASSAPSSAESAKTVAAGPTRVGPGPIASVYHLGAYRIALRNRPNRAAKSGHISITLSDAGRPLNGARVKITLTSLEMHMGSLSSVLPQTAPGRYSRPAPILNMAGRWRIAIAIRPRHSRRLQLTLVDRMAQ